MGSVPYLGLKLGDGPTFQLTILYTTTDVHVMYLKLGLGSLH